MEKKRIDFVVERENQLARMPAEVIPVGNRNARRNLQRLVKLQQ